MLNSEEVNKKVRIQNIVQSSKNNIETDKIKLNLINKINPDISINLSKYYEEDIIKIKRKALFNSLKNYLTNFEENIEKNKKKKIYRIKKRNKNVDKLNVEINKINLEENKFDLKINDEQKKINDFTDLQMSSLNAFRLSLLIRLYGFYVGRKINDRVFSKINV